MSAVSFTMSAVRLQTVGYGQDAEPSKRWWEGSRRSICSSRTSTMVVQGNSNAIDTRMISTDIIAAAARPNCRRFQSHQRWRGHKDVRRKCGGRAANAERQLRGRVELCEATARTWRRRTACQRACWPTPCSAYDLEGPV